MKIILLADSLGFGGAQRQIANLAVCLKELGHDIVFVRYRKDDFYLSILDKAEISPLLIERKNAFSRMLAIRKEIRKISPDVLISFMTVPNFYACMASGAKHKWKVIISERVANESAFLSKKLKPFISMQAKRADKIVCNSKSAEELWKKYYPKTMDKLTTIYNIIDVPEIETQKKEDGKCRFLVAARYEKEKNLDGLLEGISLLSDAERSRLELHWYGKANIAGAAESVYDNACRLVKEKGFDKCVFLHQATDKIYQIMAEVDYLSLFSHREGLPNAIIEGMTLKKPIVMSRVSDYSVLVDESNGFLCDPGSPEDIARAIRAALSTTIEERAKMGEASYEKIQAVCSRDAVIERWSDLIVEK